MRRNTVTAGVGVIAVWVGLAIAAGGAAAQDLKPQAVDITPVRDKVVVLRTDAGHFVVIEPFDTGSEHFYFGDEKRLYRQRAFSGSANGKTQFSRTYWSPRTKRSSGEIEFRDGRWALQCDDRTTALVEVEGKQASDVVNEGKFFTPLWTRIAHFLARDDDGKYYYVDKDRPDGSAGHRLYVGPKGSLKPVKLKNVVEDSEGALYVSAKGKLKTTPVRGQAPKSQWLAGRGRKTRTVELTTVPAHNNVYLIYAQLGVYEGKQLGTPCDFY